MKIWKPDEIKALRNGIELSQAKMGELFGVSADYIYSLEKGRRTPGKSLCLLMDRIKAEKTGSVRGMSTTARKKAKK